MSEQDSQCSIHGVGKNLPSPDATSDLLGQYLTIPDE